MNILPPEFVRTPEHLKYFHAVHGDLAADNIQVQQSDSYALGTLAINLSLMDEATQMIKEFGAIMESTTEKGTTRKANPALKLLADSQLAARALFKQLKMTPESRGNVALSATDKTMANDGFDQV